MPNFYSETKYDGPEAIVVAMDIGTTHSAVSFAHLSPGSQPQGKMVAHWPGQAHWSGAAKIPSMVSYRGPEPKCGAEASQDFDEDKDNVAYWFKLRVNPDPGLISEASRSHKFQIPPLPTGITIERVYSDLMKYLMVHTRAFFEITTANGAEIWERVRDTIVIVLATPNMWGMREQAILRKAATTALLVTEENAGHLLQFVTEGEASVHYALAQDRCEWLKQRTIFGVIDCGGSTVDTTIYRCVSTSPLGLTETCPNECVQAGGIFVDFKVEKMLRARLEGSFFGQPETFKEIIHAFEKELKPKFDGSMDNYDFKFGVNRDNDEQLRIRKGRISLSNAELKPLFDDVIDRILKSCLNSLIKQKTEYVILVGGFAESPYVRRALSQELGKHGIRKNGVLEKPMQTIMVGDYAKKAAAEGAIIGHIKQSVHARAVKATFGGCVRERYVKKLHRERKSTAKVYADGEKRVDDVFHVWVTKGTVLQGTFAHKLPYHVAWDASSTSTRDIKNKLGAIEIEVFAWEGDSIPMWCKDENGTILEGMRLICTLNANLSSLAQALRVQNGRGGRTFYRVDYNVCVYFGGTQLRANLQWKERGVVREGPVAVMPYVS